MQIENVFFIHGITMLMLRGFAPPLWRPAAMVLQYQDQAYL